MSNTHWRKALTGDFAKSGKWDDGRPGIKDDAFIAATGAAYTVKVISADAAHSLTLDSVNATLLEKAQGSLHVGTLDIEAGTAILTTANTIGSIVVSAGLLAFSNSAALGNATISLSRAGTLEATANAEISNDIIAASLQATFAVKNRSTLKLDGALTFNTHTSQTLNFIGNGVVDIDGQIGTASAHSFLTIKGVTLGSSIADNSGFDTYLSSTQILKIDSNGVLDLTGQDNVTLQNLQGPGSLLNSGPHEHLTAAFISLSGGVTGDFDLTVDAGAFGGTLALSSGDTIHVTEACQFDDVHFESPALTIDLEDSVGGGTLWLTGATFSGTAPAIDLGTGQNSSLSIDHTFGGTISNFGGHGGGTDHIFIDDVTDSADPTLHYKPNEAGTGGELIVKYETMPAFVLNFEGTYTQDDFKIDPKNGAEIDGSAEQSSPQVPVHVMDALI